MASGEEITLPATRRTRRSIGAQSPNKRGKDKENATIDVGATTATLAANRKKSRSKSIGPGSLDILKPGAGNRRASLAVPPKPLPRGILKQPIQPLPELPPFRLGNDTKDTLCRTPEDSAEGTATSGMKIALRTEEEQQAAAREREERERAQLEKEEKDRREARRKSLANRRVSFAAEATLHMWDVVEAAEQDSTTSTDRNRRASSQPQNQLSSDASEPPSTPPAAVIEDPIELADDQREAHQKKNRRRSSGIPSRNFNDPDDYTTSSTVYSSDSEHADGVAEIQGEEMSDSDSDAEDGTMMTLDADEMTSASVTQMAQQEDQEDSTSLDENLRVASQRASTMRVEDSDDEEAIPAFGWVKKSNVAPQAVSELSARMMDAVQRSPRKEEEDDEMSSEMEMDVDEDTDMEITNAVGGILRSATQRTPSPEKENNEEQDMDMNEDMSMDVTRVLGGILAMGQPSTARGQSVRRPPPPPPEGDEEDEGAAMELTMAVGGIMAAGRTSGGSTDLEAMEDMSMEITTAIGGVLSQGKGRSPVRNRRRSMAASTNYRPANDADSDNDGAMDMTTAVGCILPTVAKGDQEEDDHVEMDITMGMDMTTAIGGIIKTPSKQQHGQPTKNIMGKESNERGPAELTRSSPKKRPQTIADENGSPAPNGTHARSPRRASLRQRTTTPKLATPQSTKAANSTTPKTAPASPSRSKAIADVEARRTPSRTPSPLKMVPPRSASPKQLQSPVRAVTPRSVTKSRLSLFHHNPETGATTPRVILSPHRRRLSGVGLDRPGLGSPRISEILDRRSSIGDAASSFSPVPVNLDRKGVSFADPRAMVEEIDRERREEEERENARKVLEREADGDITATLKDMITSMSPIKPPRPHLKGRKSLAVGSGKGLLGKRPAELDENEEEDERDGVKRLKGLQGSPVKNVRLSSPPTKEETTTGRRTKAAAAKDDTTTPSIRFSPLKISSPEAKGRFRSVDDQPSTTLNLQNTASITDAEVEKEADEDRIHLQDFLNMTSIRFMELTTTKRRHTIAPTHPRDSSVSDGKDEMSLERCVVAGACTVPMLELYQHSCRELKKYISEGRRIVREIETETFEENPPLFREYISASPEFKLIMDNQFKNVKTHARLLSKAMWYEWRMKLQDGLKEGLIKIAEGMTEDDEMLSKQEKLLQSVLPELVKKYEKLEHENEELEAVARELADCDPADLEAARADLLNMDRLIEEKTRQVALLRQELEESEEGIKSMASQKEKCVEDIKEADKIREECRGWSSTEIATLKAKVDQFEKSHGWAITGISGSVVSLAYRREIELVLDISAFQPENNKGNANIDLWYIASAREYSPVPCTAEREFYLQCIRDQLRGLPQSATKLSRMLGIVSAAWDQSGEVVRHVRSINVAFPTTVHRTGDNMVEVRTEVLVVPLRSKVEVLIEMTGMIGGLGDVVVDVNPRARVIYGESFNEKKMGEFLQGRIGLGQGKMEAWGDVVGELHGRLLAKGRKA